MLYCWSLSLRLSFSLSINSLRPCISLPSVSCTPFLKRSLRAFNTSPWLISSSDSWSIKLSASRLKTCWVPSHREYTYGPYIICPSGITLHIYKIRTLSQQYKKGFKLPIGNQANIIITPVPILFYMTLAPRISDAWRSAQACASTSKLATLSLGISTL